MNPSTTTNTTTGPSKGDALDASAKANASNGAAGGSSQPCPKIWTLKVMAVTKDSAKGTGAVNITAGSRTAALSFLSDKGFASTGEATFAHDAPETFDVTGASDDMIVEGGPQPVSMQNGDKKSVMLTLRPRPWIGFQFTDEKSKKDVAGIKLGLNLPKKGEIEETSIEGELKIKGLDDGTGEVKKTSCDDVVWSVEKLD